MISPNLVSQTAEPPQFARRGFLVSSATWAFRLGVAAMALVGGLWTVAIGRFFVPAVGPPPPVRFKAGYPRDYTPGTVESKFKDRYGAWVVCTGGSQPRVFALRATCTHLGCLTYWNSARACFQCPCHGSTFAIDGTNLGGPAPRPLERLVARLTEDGQIEVELTPATAQSPCQTSAAQRLPDPYT